MQYDYILTITRTKIKSTSKKVRNIINNFGQKISSTLTENKEPIITGIRSGLVIGSALCCIDVLCTLAKADEKTIDRILGIAAVGGGVGGITLILKGILDPSD